MVFTKFVFALVNQLERVLFPLCLFGIVFILCADIYLRNVFQLGLVWGFDANAYLLLVCLFAILPANARTDSHLRMDLLTTYILPSAKPWVDRLTDVIGLSLFLLLSYQSILSTEEMYLYEETPEILDIPLWPISLFIVLSAILCALVHGQRLITSFNTQTSDR